MKSRMTIAVFVLVLAATASPAFASALAPAAGKWSDPYGETTFVLKKTPSGYRAVSTYAFIGGDCQNPQGEKGLMSRGMEARGFTVKLARSGQRLRGSKRVITKRKRNRVTQTVRLTITITGTRRATVSVSGKYDTKGYDPNAYNEECAGRETRTVRAR